MGNFAENLNLGNRVRPPPALTRDQLCCPLYGSDFYFFTSLVTFRVAIHVTRTNTYLLKYVVFLIGVV